MLESALKSPPALVEGGREKPRRTKDWERAVNDSNQDGNKAGYDNVPLCGASST